MIIVKILNLQNELKHQARFETQDEATAWIANQEAKTHTWRIKEGYYPEKKEGVEPKYVTAESMNGQNYAMYYYEKNYRIEIIDTDTIPALYNKEQINKRKKEYPALEDVVDAILDNLAGDDEKLKDINKIRKAIKDKYPFKNED